MLNPFREINWQPGVKERRKFAASLMIGFPCLALAFLLIGRFQTGAWQTTPPLALAGIGFAVGAALWLAPQIARPVYLLWYAVACTLGLVVGNLLLAAVFYLVFAPLGLVLRLFGRRALTKKIDRGASTYWQDATAKEDAARYYRQF